MHVLHFLPAYVPAWQFGGPILSVSRLCEGLADQDGIEVRVITTNAGLPNLPTDQLGTAQSMNGVDVFYYAVNSQRGAIRSNDLVSSLAMHLEWADILHVSSIWQPLGIPVQKAAHSAGVPVVQSLRGALGPYSWKRSLWKKIPYFLLFEWPLLQRATVIHCTTPQESREVSWLRLKPKIQILPNSVSVSQIKYDATTINEWRILNAIPLDHPLLLVVGRLHHKKGLELLPQVLKRLSHKPWHILFIGKDEDGTGVKLKNAFSHLCLSERSHWLETMPAKDLGLAYSAGDLLLLPSRHENFGNVIAEALGFGCAVLTTNRAAIWEYLRGCPGCQVVPRTSNNFFNALNLMIDQKRPGRAAERFINALFSTQTVSERAASIYQKLLEDG